MPWGLRGAVLVLASTSLVLTMTACSPSAPSHVTATPATRATAAPASPSPTPSPTPTFDRAARSIDDPASLWVVVNKLRPLQPKTYVPKDLVPVPVPHTNPPILRKVAAQAVVRLFRAAKTEAHLALASNSTYRPFTDQQRVYEADKAHLGLAAADRLDLHPGYSEHQTGLAIDIGDVGGHCDLNTCFARTAEGRWLAANAWRFGFVLRYPKGAGAITGIDFEPWHYRYVGTDLARELHGTHTRTLEQFFGLPPAPTYG